LKKRFGTLGSGGFNHFMLKERDQEPFMLTGLCQSNIEINGKWSPCTRPQDPEDPRNLCKECVLEVNKIFDSLSDNEGI
jgi:hypothetical protein